MAWPLAAVLYFLAMPFVLLLEAEIELWIMGAIAILILIGAARFLRPDMAPVSHPRLALVGAATILILWPGSLVPRWLYRWPVIENDAPVPYWASSAAWWVLYGLVALLFVLLLWLARVVLERLDPRPGPMRRAAVFLTAWGVWTLALGMVIVRTDHTSEDILFTTFPFGLGAVFLGGVIVSVEALVRCVRPPAAPP